MANETSQRDKAARRGVRRLTLDLDENLHRQLKIRCAMEQTTIADLVRELLKERLRIL